MLLSLIPMWLYKISLLHGTPNAVVGLQFSPVCVSVRNPASPVHMSGNRKA
jgi:hypothetical protein